MHSKFEPSEVPVLKQNKSLTIIKKSYFQKNIGFSKETAIQTGLVFCQFVQRPPFSRKPFSTWVFEAHTFKSQYLGVQGMRIIAHFRPSWATERGPGQPELQYKILYESYLYTILTERI